jgi:hypothetical protein
VLLNERWLWLGEAISPVDAGVAVYEAYRGSWWLTVGGEMIGPFDDRSILRALRVACTPTIDGCERGPTQLGVNGLTPRRPLRRGPRWRPASEEELPASVTTYVREALEPVSGCCSVSDAMPTARWTSAEAWEGYVDEAPSRVGRLTREWNAHPAGCLLLAPASTLDAGFTVVDLAESHTRG